MKTIYRCSFLVGIVILVIVGISGCRPAEFPTTIPAATSTPTAIPIPAWLADLPTDTKLPATEVPQIDPTPATYPLGGGVQESFERGEYTLGMNTAAKWVTVWAEMGIFQNQEAGQSGNTLNFDPLDGRARIGCVDTKGVGPFAGQWLCPPLDLVNGGLRPLPTGSWDRNADGPLFITLDSTEELKTKGTGTDMAYQIINRYTKVPLRYIDPKTGQYVEGEYQVPGGEIKLPTIVPESMNQIPEFTFNMEFKDPKAAYRMLLETVVGSNLHNENFWRQTLGTATPMVDQLLAFAKNNVGGPENKPYWLPFETASGTRFNFLAVRGNMSNLRSTKPQVDGVYLDGIYNMFFYSEDLKDPAKYDFIRKLKFDNKQVSMGLINQTLDGVAGAEFGLLLVNNRFVYVSGSEGLIGDPIYYEQTLGGSEKIFMADRDPAIMSAQFLSYLKAMKSYTGDNSYIGMVCTYSEVDCKGGIYSDSLASKDWVVKVK